VHTYHVYMNRNLTISLDEQLIERTREVLRSTGKTMSQEIREHFQHLIGDGEQLTADLEFLEKTAGLGNSSGWKFNREELYERR